MKHKQTYDPELGMQIHDHLVKMGVESPINFDVYSSTTDSDKINFIESRMKEVLQIMGFDLQNDSVYNTPYRVAKMMVKETMSGLDYSKFPRIMVFENTFRSSSMVVERNMKSMSVCSHHIVTIDGVCNVAYIPGEKVIGLSKISRVVDFFSRRPQEAERLVQQIYYALQFILGVDDVAVYLSGVHYCLKSRGANEADADTVTAKLGGAFKNDSQTRKEFYDIIHKSS